MADNITLNAGTGGSTLATDDAGAAGHVQIVKLALSADGSATPITADANGIEVQGAGTAGTAAGGVVSIQGVASMTAVVVDGSAVTQPVSHGALTELAAAINASSQMDCNIATALPAGANAIGKLAANSGVDIGDVDILSIAAGDNNIGNVDVVSQIPGTGATNLGKAEDGAHTSGDTGVMLLGVRNDTPNAALAGTDLDYSPIGLYRDGSIRVAPPESDFAVLGSNSVKKYYTNAGAVTDGIVWSPAAGKRWYVTDIYINISAAATITLEDDLVAGDSAVWKGEFAANSGWSHSFSTPLFSGEDAADLIITTSAGNVYVTVTGYEI